MTFSRLKTKKLLHIPWKSLPSEFSKAMRPCCSAACADRFVDILLGDGAAAPHKLECANPLTVLGVQTRIDAAGVTFKPNPTKVAEWTEQMQSYLRLGLLSSGEASKLAGELAPLQHCELAARLCAGRLSFASQHVFKRLGRALLVPIFKQIRSRSAEIKEELQMALSWWLETLKLGMSEVRSDSNNIVHSAFDPFARSDHGGRTQMSRCTYYAMLGHCTALPTPCMFDACAAEGQPHPELGQYSSMKMAA